LGDAEASIYRIDMETPQPRRVDQDVDEWFDDPTLAELEDAPSASHASLERDELLTESQVKVEDL
jgi:hypothetical protein